jgi:hypothetical protein
MKKELQRINSLQDKKKYKTLVKILENGEYKARILSARALGELGSQIAVVPLRKATEDKVRTVAIEAVKALKKISLDTKELEELNYLQNKLEEEERQNKQQQLINKISHLSNQALVENIESNLDEFEVKLLDDEINKRGGVAELKADIDLQKKKLEFFNENKKNICVFCGKKKMNCHEFQFKAGNKLNTSYHQSTHNQFTTLVKTSYQISNSSFNCAVCEDCLKQYKKNRLHYIPFGLILFFAGIGIVIGAIAEIKILEDFYVIGGIISIMGIGLIVKFFTNKELAEEMLKKDILENSTFSDIWTEKEYKEKFKK